jgi:hypothetical protein
MPFRSIRRRASALAFVAALAGWATPAALGAPVTIRTTCDLPGLAAAPVEADVEIPESLPTPLASPYRLTGFRSDALDDLDPAVTPSVRFYLSYRPFEDSGAFPALADFAYPLAAPIAPAPVLVAYPGPGRLTYGAVQITLTTRNEDGTTTVDRRQCVEPEPEPAWSIPVVYPIPQPTDVTATDVQPTSIKLAWKQDGPADVRFEVFWENIVEPFEGDVVKSAIPELRLTGLRPSTLYLFDVAAISQQGYSKTPDNVLAVTTPPEPLGQHSFRLAGATAIPKLFQGNANVSGALSYSLNADGSLADTSLKLDPVTVPLVLERNVPVTAKLTFLTAAKPTGTLQDGVLNVAAAIRVKVTDARLFGTVPIATGSNCQARDLTRFALSSPVGFSRDVGGSMLSGYEFSDLVGCTGLNGLLSRATTSRSNTLTLKATPASS